MISMHFSYNSSIPWKLVSVDALDIYLISDLEKVIDCCGKDWQTFSTVVGNPWLESQMIDKTTSGSLARRHILADISLKHCRTANASRTAFHVFRRHIAG